ncbi:MAG: endopeptidase La [Bacteroidales bacterium]|nr:endopeptidase La [Bacteroidales bacterium]
MDNFNDGGGELPYGIQKIEIDLTRFDGQPDENNLPLLPTRNLVLFPGQHTTMELGRPASMSLASDANAGPFPIGIVCQTDPHEEEPKISTGLYHYGTVADVLNVFERPDGVRIAFVRARGKFRIMGKGKGENQKPGRLYARVKLIEDPLPTENQQMEFEATCAQIRTMVNKTLESSDPTGIRNVLGQIRDDVDMLNYLCTNLPITVENKNELLAARTVMSRAFSLLGFVGVFEEQMKLTQNIMNKAKRSMEENQRNAFLQQQMEAIRETLYGDGDEVDELLAKAEMRGMPDKVWELFQKESEKLRRYNPNSPDYSVLYSYLETLIALPWQERTDDQTDFTAAEKILEEDHYGLEKVKERVLEQLAVLMHKPDGKAPILCLVGAPGVGKTSIGKSVARALGRVYERVSFGGLHDEAEIRGHRRTYIGAMPGRIIDAIKRAKVVNPVIVLDEIDKIGADYKGDPGAALLEVLDPEQNCRFHDNYVDIDYDLSDVLFIATANTLSTISRPLLDRMEIINIDGYLREEKMEIARRYLIPRVARELDTEINITDEALAAVISEYTSESGVRTLEKRLSALGRKHVLAQMKGESFPDPILKSDLYGLLGLAPYTHSEADTASIPGLVNGLAWTEVGGEVLQVESSLSAAPDKSIGNLTLTGKLGDVMKESASVAFQWVRSNARALGIAPEAFEGRTLHIHFPEGAVPKDGPSAGITIATSIVSTFTGVPVIPGLAMTGEITLRGKVLPVGGIREKILAAKREGLTHLVLSQQNRRDIEDIPASYREGLEFTFVDSAAEVIKLALAKKDENVE